MDEKQEKRFKTLKWTAVIFLVIFAIMCFFTFKQASNYANLSEEQGVFGTMARMDKNRYEVHTIQIVGYIIQFALLVGIIVGCINKKAYSAILAIIVGILFIISLDIVSIFIGLLLILDGYYILKNNK